MDTATVDAHGMCIGTSLYRYVLRWTLYYRSAMSDVSVWGQCIHIGVGFGVAHSAVLGNAKASRRGMGGGGSPRFFNAVKLSLTLTVSFVET